MIKILATTVIALLLATGAFAAPADWSGEGRTDSSGWTKGSAGGSTGWDTNEFGGSDGWNTNDPGFTRASTSGGQSSDAYSNAWANMNGGDNYSSQSSDGKAKMESFSSGSGTSVGWTDFKGTSVSWAKFKFSSN